MAVQESKSSRANALAAGESLSFSEIPSCPSFTGYAGRRLDDRTDGRGNESGGTTYYSASHLRKSGNSSPSRARDWRRDRAEQDYSRPSLSMRNRERASKERSA